MCANVTTSFLSRKWAISFIFVWVRSSPCGSLGGLSPCKRANRHFCRAKSTSACASRSSCSTLCLEPSGAEARREHIPVFTRARSGIAAAVTHPTLTSRHRPSAWAGRPAAGLLPATVGCGPRHRVGFSGSPMSVHRATVKPLSLSTGDRHEKHHPLALRRANRWHHCAEDLRNHLSQPSRNPSSRRPKGVVLQRPSGRFFYAPHLLGRAIRFIASRTPAWPLRDLPAPCRPT